MKRWVFIVTIVAAVSVAAYVIGSWIVYHDRPSGAMCTGVAITVEDSAEAHYVTVQDIADQLHRTGQYPVGLQYSEVHPNLMEQALLQNPMVHTADCRKLISGVVAIKVTQRHPVLRVSTPRSDYYIDDERKKLPVTSADASYVPIVTGFPKEDFVRGPLYDFVEALRADSFWNA